MADPLRKPCQGRFDGRLAGGNRSKMGSRLFCRVEVDVEVHRLEELDGDKQRQCAVLGPRRPLLQKPVEQARCLLGG
ncbi:MAG TPA: hypothetical protein VNA57_05210 [Acidimicrobiales bacterium]|nr:hypothetical protein [Acidimicrobiales bacterium]